MATAFSWRPIEPFGVHVDVDLKRPLSDADKAELRRLYAIDGLLHIAGLELSMRQQIEFCEIFGPVLKGAHDTFLVSNVVKDGLFANLELRFHHDIPYVPAPFLAGCLHALEVSEGVSATRFASGFRAYDRLPQALRDRIEGMNALFVRGRSEHRRSKLTDSVPGDNCAVHGVVQRQRGTGRPYLFVDKSMAACIIGLSDSDSDALLEELFSYLYGEEDIYDHNWKKGDLVLWDNVGLQHARAKIEGGVRTLQRVTVALLGYEQQYPADSIWYSDLQEGRGFGDRRAVA
jgi:taurine dioxygenase